MVYNKMMDSRWIMILCIVLICIDCGNIHWENYPYCSGNTQSPREINTQTLRDGYDVCVPHLNWIIKHHTSWKVINTGHTIKLTPYNNTGIVATLPNQFGPVYDVNGEYCFDSLHFHWASNNDLGSEHTFDGKRYELEIHFVHYSCDYNNISKALEASQNGIEILDPYTLGVIGVMAEKSNVDNPSFNLILNELPNIQYPAGIYSNVSGEAIIHGFDIADILPYNRDEFYYYKGSLTTPPCNPIVRWHVLQNIIQISDRQLTMLRRAMADTTTPESNNYRALQYNINPVYECLHGSSTANDNSDHKSKKNVDSTMIAMIIVGIISIIAIIAVIVEFKMSYNNSEKQTRTTRLVSHSHAPISPVSFNIVSTPSTPAGQTNLHL
mmetsp:Transcript_64095/g.78396  ORF Transcript_64095/g.78396 Transcript_64095/m.78396 type:complete len:382 (-) Transcript_64095:34-1179(-)